MPDHDGIWECPVCQAKAEVKGRDIHVFLLPSFKLVWPLHPDCELGKDIDHIDFSKLTKVG